MHNIIELKNIYKGYRIGKNFVDVIRDINMSVANGEFIALMGPSGSGRSTLMNIVGCLDSVDKGTYYLDGKDISAYSEDELSEARNKTIGFIFQNFNLIADLTVLENITMPSIYAGKENVDRALKLAEKLGIKERVNHYPNELSGGQRQRVAIARALMNKPKIILADEPTGNLDSHSAKEVMEILKQMNENEGKTIILVTHDEFTASFASRRVKLKDGVFDLDEA